MFLVDIYHGYNGGFIREGHDLEDLLEAVILDRDGVQVGPVLGAVDVESGLGVVAVVADQVCLVRSDDDVLEVRERVGELPVDLTLGERPDQSEVLEVRDSH